MHTIIRQLEKDKAKVMAEQFASERKLMQSAEAHKRNPYKGTSYPKDYKTYIPTPIPEPQTDAWEEAKKEIRRVSYEIKDTNTESSNSRYD